MKVRAGQSVSRSDVERVVAERAKVQEMIYRVLWSAAAKRSSTLVTQGEAFSAPLLSGKAYDFSEVLGKKPVVLTFWASWCAPCIEEAPQLQRMFEMYAPKGVAFAAVSIDEPDDYPTLRTLVADKALTYPVPLDPRGEILATYADGASIPLTFVLSRSGDVVYRHHNFEAGDEIALKAAIEAQLEQ